MKMDENGQKWTKMAQITSMAQNGPKCSKMIKNDQKKLKLPKTTDTTGKGMSMAKMAKNAPILV